MSEESQPLWDAPPQDWEDMSTDDLLRWQASNPPRRPPLSWRVGSTEAITMLSLYRLSHTWDGRSKYGEVDLLCAALEEADQYLPAELAGLMAEAITALQAAGGNESYSRLARDVRIARRFDELRAQGQSAADASDTILNEPDGQALGTAKGVEAAVKRGKTRGATPLFGSKGRRKK